MAVAVQGAPSQGSREQRPGLLQRLKLSYSKHWYAYAMVAPVVIVLGVLVGYPLARGVYLTLTDANSLNVGRQIGVNHIPDSFNFVGLHNYADVLWGPGSYDRFWSHFIWTVLWTVFCVALHYTLGLGLAMLLNQKLRGRLAYRMLLILPWAVPTFVTVFSWRLMLSDSGVVNSFLGFLHLPQPSWLSDPLASKFAVVIVNTWCGVPFMMVSLLGGLQSIPAELYEAAEMDGATPWQRFRYVTLPGLRTVSSTVILLGVIWTFNQFAIIFLLLGDGSPDTQILVTWAYRLGFGQQPRAYAESATYGVLLLSILVVFTSFYRRWQVRNEENA
ncbi:MULTISPECIES: carbohydrate ABC transporter permease [Kitasatospora]|uniref:Sugar ABC transporter permease n=1 Tax=Kitasatospora cystarginea TaxID=58350 RepID=A0ABN3DNL9_9ACTN